MVLVEGLLVTLLLLLLLLRPGRTLLGYYEQVLHWKCVRCCRTLYARAAAPHRVAAARKRSEVRGITRK